MYKYTLFFPALLILFSSCQKNAEGPVSEEPKECFFKVNNTESNFSCTEAPGDSGASDIFYHSYFPAEKLIRISDIENDEKIVFDLELPDLQEKSYHIELGRADNGLCVSIYNNNTRMSYRYLPQNRKPLWNLAM